jgi:hypothetical protein
MPKVTRTRTRLHKEATPKTKDRKFAVKEKEVLERIETTHDEPQVTLKNNLENLSAIYVQDQPPNISIIID